MAIWPEQSSRTKSRESVSMAPNSIERLVTLAASVITLWSVWNAAPIGGSGSVLIFQNFSFGPRLVAVFLTDAFVIWVLSKVVFFCLQIRQSYAAFVLSLAALAINSWQSVYLFHIVLFQTSELSNIELSAFVALEVCSASMFGLLLHSHYETYSGRFRSPFHMPDGLTHKYDIFVFGKLGVVAASVLSYLPFALWAVLDPGTFYK